MTKWHAATIHILLIVAIFPLAAIISWHQSGGGVFSPEEALGQSFKTFLIALVTVGIPVGFSFIMGFMFRRPLRVLVWIPFGIALAMVAHQLVAPFFSMKEIFELGLLDAFLRYLPSVALFSLLGGLLSTMMFCKQPAQQAEEMRT